ncbi:MAG: gliding motility-associated C-terminal domain-containing protein [Bacteroidetes bacterium]|nr:gliding motility-associated C-terminal domain-containing protein [Bacteroidota bacterium]
MKSIRLFLFLLIFFSTLFWSNTVFAQRGKNGTPPAITTNTVVNEYTSLTANAAAGATTITVANSTLNTNGRFSGNLAPGDLIMIIQIQGSTISARDSNQWDPFAWPRDSSWGIISNYGNCGNWEFAEVYSIPSGTSITLDCPLTNNYTSAGRVAVVRVPRYSSLTINNGGSITCDAWNGTIGGICAIEVENNTTINAGGIIDIIGKGFRGGALLENQSTFGANEAAYKDPGFGAEKGEGIVGYQSDYNIYGGKYGKGAPANGGGGGNDHDCGGGGGANAGDTSLWNGHGNPDNSGPNWNLAWNLQYAGFSAQTSSGGGQGGYGFNGNCGSCNQNATTTGPNNASWGGDSRRSWGGCGGRPLDYSTGKLFLGGGGGSGEQSDNEGGAGGNGGALLYIMSYGTVSGAGQLLSNGNNGVNSTGTPASSSFAGRDGAGGAGAGGTIVVNSVGTISGISISANGGTGGNQIIVKGGFYFSNGGNVWEAEGPGGGGGGGYIAISTGAPIRTSNGGANGTTNSNGLTEFIPNGATKGGAGTNNASVTNFIINSPNVTICAGQAATLTATLSGTVPGGTTIIWYDQLVAGNNLGTGTTYTTTVLAVGTYTYYVGTCPGTYHQPVIVSVVSSPVVSVGPDVTMCNGSSTTLSASGGTGYAWSPVAGLSNPNISNPVATPVSTTTYVVTVTSSCGNTNDTVIVTVNSSVTASISGNTTICSGGNTTLTASGGGNYSWTTGATTGAINISPTTTTTYSVFVGSGSCADTASVTVNVTSAITASISGNTTICPGSTTTLTASGGSSYSWSTTATTSAITVSPTSNTTYSVIASSGTCVDTTSISITITNNITATVTGATTICPGGNALLSASGGNNYSWSTGATTSSITVSPTSTSSYSVIASSGTCADTVSVIVTVSSSITASITGNANICSGSNTTLTAAGGSTYSWTNNSTTNVITITPTATATYSVIVSSGTCADTTSITVNVSPTPTVSVSGNTLLCSGDATTLTASGGNIYSWSTGSTTTSITITPTVTSTYTVVSSTGICSDTDTVTVSVLPPPTAAIAGNTTICAGQITTLTASGGVNYSWIPSGQTTSSINVSTAGNYSVIVSAGSCSDTATATVNVSPAPSASVTATSPSICSGDSTTLTASGGNTYAWNSGATGISIIVFPNATTSYTVIASNGTCSDTATITVSVISSPTATISGIGICQGSAATITASGGQTYFWSTGETTSVINPTTAGTYSVIAYAGTCTDTASTNLTVNPNPTATTSPNITITQGQSTNLTAGGGTTYVWDNSMTGANITVSPVATTIYCVTVYDANGCQDTACVTVFVELCSKAGTLYLPNAFSPNVDGENDSLQIYYGIPECIKTLHLVIYNRWGEKVYETNDSAFKWGGVYNSSLLKETNKGDTEVYAYYLDVEIVDGIKISKKGNISLVK